MSKFRLEFPQSLIPRKQEYYGEAKLARPLPLIPSLTAGEQEKLQRLLALPFWYHETSQRTEITFSATMGSNPDLDAGRLLAGKRDCWKHISSKRQEKQCHKQIILSDPTCLCGDLSSEDHFETVLFIIQNLYRHGFSISGLDKNGSLIPLTLQIDPYKSSMEYGFKHVSLRKLQMGRAEIIAQQLSRQGLDLQNFCVLDSTLLSTVVAHLDLLPAKDFYLYEKLYIPANSLILPIIANVIELSRVKKITLSDSHEANHPGITASIPLLNKLRSAKSCFLALDLEEVHALKLPSYSSTITELTLEVSELINFPFPWSAFPYLKKLNIYVQVDGEDDVAFWFKELAVLPRNLTSLTVTKKNYEDDNDPTIPPSYVIYGEEFLKSTQKLSRLTTLKKLVFLALGSLEDIPKNIEELEFDCSALASLQLDFSSFTKLTQLTIHCREDRQAELSITGFTGAKMVFHTNPDEFTSSTEGDSPQDAVDDEAESAASDATITHPLDQVVSDTEPDFSTYTSPDSHLFTSFVITQKGWDGAHEKFTSNNIRQSVVNNFSQITDLYPEGWEDLHIQQQPTTALLDNSCLKAGEGICRLHLPSSANWQPLPRRSRQDCITDFAAPKDSAIRYNLSTDQYEILLPGTATKHFLQYKLKESLTGPHNHSASYTVTPLTEAESTALHTRFPSVPLKTTAVPVLITWLKNDVVRFFHAFRNEELSGQPLLGDRFSWLDILSQQKGACRHRASAFIKLCQELGVAARIIANEIHEFVEIFDSSTGQWSGLDLGGRASELTEVDALQQYNPLALPESWTALFSATSSSKTYSSQAEVFADLLSQNNPCLELSNLAATRGFYTGLLSQKATSSPPIMYIESAAELVDAWSMQSIDAQGRVISLPGPLQTDFLARKGIVIIAWERFTASEIATYKSLLDTPPTMFGVPTDSLKVLSLITPKVEACSAFYSRIQKFTWPAAIDLPEPLEVMPTAAIAQQEATPSSSSSSSSSAMAPQKRKKRLREEKASSSHSTTGRPLDAPGSRDQVAGRHIGATASSLQRSTGSSSSSSSSSHGWSVGSSESQPIASAEPTEQITGQRRSATESYDHGSAGSSSSSSSFPGWSAGSSERQPIASAEPTEQITGQRSSATESYDHGSTCSSSSSPSSRGLSAGMAARPVMAIDLYGDKYGWRQRLLGQFKLGAQGAYFQTGALAKPALAKGNAIVELIDPPWDDADFQSFILRSEQEKAVWINGKRINLGAGFCWHFASSTPAPAIQPTLITELPVVSEPTKIFYVNRQTFSSLFTKVQLKANNEILETPGWLMQAGSGKQLIQTEELTPGQLRQIADAITPSIQWTKLSTAISLKQAKITESKTSPLSKMPATVVISHDPHFLAEQWQSQFALSIAINPSTSTSDILEKIQLLPSESKSTPGKPQCSHTMQAVAQALLAGKNVLLHGQLSHDMYLSLETLLAPQPYLALIKPPARTAKLGQLHIVTMPVDFPIPVVEKNGGSQTLSQSSLWPAYEERLKKDLGERFIPKHWQQLHLFYQIAETLPPPASIRLSYSRLLSALRLLQEPILNDDNPIKGLLLHDFDHSSNTYAFLNVIGKYLFGRTDQMPAQRQEKLKKYPDTSSAYWQKLNCLNASALRQILPTDIRELWHKPPAIDWHKVQSQYPLLAKNPSPVGKLSHRLTTALQFNRMLVLKGPPGTGKTYAANAYVAQQKGRSFWSGNPEQILQWLNDKGKNPAVLIVDEANLQAAGTWDYLRPLLAAIHPSFTSSSSSHDLIAESTESQQIGSPGSRGLSVESSESGLIDMPRSRDQAAERPIGATKSLASDVPTIIFNGKSYTLGEQHRVIFTCNPENFVGRETHDLLQDVPTLYVNAWADEDLLNIVMLPLAEEILDATLSSEKLSALIALRQTYRWMQDNLPPNQLSLRDLQSLVARWARYLTQFPGSSPLLLAEKACRNEWQQRFMQADQASNFDTFLQQSILTLAGKDEELEDRAYLEDTEEMAVSSSYLPSTQQQRILTQVIEDMALARSTASFLTLDGSTIAKQGVLIEGSSGFGKSELFKQALLQQGYTAASSIALSESSGHKRFIQFTTSGNTQTDRRFLEQAFDRGYVVILDELNLDPSLEALLNHLLTGKTPSGKTATLPGFFLLASQNSGSSAGRKSVSAALQNRLHVFYVNEHSEQELLDYMKKVFDKTLADETLQGMVQSYIQARESSPADINDRRFFQCVMQLREWVKQDLAKNPDGTLEERNKNIQAQLQQLLEKPAIIAPKTIAPPIIASLPYVSDRHLRNGRKQKRDTADDKSTHPIKRRTIKPFRTSPLRFFPAAIRPARRTVAKPTEIKPGFF